jgi:hypothetical protein
MSTRSVASITSFFTRRSPQFNAFGFAKSQLRFSVSWKAYCFRDAHERDTWRDHLDDLTIDLIVDRLVEDLRARGRVSGDVARDAELGLLLIDEYVRFPVSTPSSTS